jgi:hypothetical protein
MKILNSWLNGRAAVCLALLLAIPIGQAAPALAQEPAPGVPSPQAKEDMQASNATMPAVSTNALPDSPAPPSVQAQDQGQAPAQAPGPGDQNAAQKPVGTAAAPYEKTVGVAASRPAGAAIAPAKQRRVRTFLISAGLIAGAAIAVGSVAALSHGSASRP